MTAQPPRLVLVALCALACAQFACVNSWDQPRTHGGSADHVISSEVNGDVMRAGGRVSVEAEVRGDVAAAGRDVSIQAPVDGYVMGAGRHVSLNGAVANDAWLAGETVRVGGSVGSNAMLAGRDVQLARNATFAQDVRVGANALRSEATIERDLIVGASTVEIGGEIGGTVRANANRVTLLPGTIVRGDLVVRSPEQPIVPADAQVMGTVRYDKVGGSSWALWPLYFVGAFLALLVLGLVMLGLFPAWIARVSDTMKAHVASSVLSGLLLIILTPIVIGALLVTLIGIPLAVVLVALYVAAMVLSTVFVSYRIGHWLLEQRRQPGVSPWNSMIVGALVVALAVTIPGVGWILGTMVMLVGAGALALERRSSRHPAPTAAM